MCNFPALSFLCFSLSLSLSACSILFSSTQLFSQGKPETFQNCPKGDPALPVPYDLRFPNTNHASLRVVSEPSHITRLPVQIVTGSNGKSTSLILKSTDTIGKLKQKYIKKRQPTEGCLNLVFNGKPVKDDQRLGVLGVKAGAETRRQGRDQCLWLRLVVGQGPTY